MGVMCKPGSVGAVTRNYGCICCDWIYNQDTTRCVTTGPYQDVRSEQSGGTNSWDDVTSPFPGGRAPREGTRRLLTPRRSGARVVGLADSSELLINVVRSSKPKA